MVKPGDMIAVWFSCGAASAVAAKLVVDQYADTCLVRILNTPVIEEGPDNQRFRKDVQDWLSFPIEDCINPKYPNCSAVEVWEKHSYMSGTKGARCTLELKKKARYHWESIAKPDWHVLGFTVDEKHRYEKFILTERDNVLPVLIDAELSKEDCFRIIDKAGIRLPEPYHLGYPNANCRGCVKASSPTYWNHVRIVDPDVFEARAKQSRSLGVRLVRVKGERIYLDELDPKAKGRPMKSMQMDCGIFCEEP